jgi:hypothetical protein
MITISPIDALGRAVGQNLHDKTEREIIDAIGRYLYGREYRGPLARALGRDYRWIQRWTQGKAEVPPDAYRQLLELVRQRNRDYAR